MPRHKTEMLLLASFLLILGLPDAVIGVAWPTVRDTFSLPQGAAGTVFVASGLGYFITSFFSGRLTQILGIGLLLAASTGLVAAAMFGFAGAPAWALFVASSCSASRWFIASILRRRSSRTASCDGRDAGAGGVGSGA